MSRQTGNRTKHWELNATAFQGLLSWLDDSDSSSGQSYLELRQRLVTYFERKDCPASEDLADETLNRVARTLQEKGTIDNVAPAQYCYITARFVFLENLRERQNYRPLPEARSPLVTDKTPTDIDDENLVRERMLNCLERCTEKLGAANRDLILGYYVGKQQIKIQNRRDMAQQLGITINALSIRACRIREKLATCVKQCLSDNEILL